MASLVDTNVLVYRVDPRDPARQRVANALLRDGIGNDALVLPHQALVEFVAAVTRPRAELGGEPLLPPAEALRETESLMAQFRVIYPGPELLLTAMRGMALYGLSWLDAHLWACAEAGGIPELLSEDFEHGRHYGRVRVVNPFLAVGGTVQELPPLYAD